MNLSITRAVAAATDCVVSYIIAPDAVTIYKLTKNIHGKPADVCVNITPEIHANVQSDEVARVIVEQAKARFKELREAK